MSNSSNDPLFQRPVDWFQAGQRWGEHAQSRSATIEEKLNIMAETAAERGEPFNRAGMRRDLRGGKERGPFIAINGTPCRTAKLRDRYNNDFRQAIWEGTQEFEWAFKEVDTFDAGAWRSVQPKEVVTEFDAIWEEARQELLDAGRYTFIDGVLREVPLGLGDGVQFAYISFELQRPGVFARVWRALKEAIRE